MSYEFKIFLLGVNTVFIGLGLLLGYKFLGLAREFFEEMKKLIRDLEEDK